jgi:hypothetical protein
MEVSISKRGYWFRKYPEDKVEGSRGFAVKNKLKEDISECGPMVEGGNGGWSGNRRIRRRGVWAKEGMDVWYIWLLYKMPKKKKKRHRRKGWGKKGEAKLFLSLQFELTRERNASPPGGKQGGLGQLITRREGRGRRQKALPYSPVCAHRGEKASRETPRGRARGRAEGV